MAAQARPDRVAAFLFEPSAGGVVVVGAEIDHRILAMVLRQVGVVGAVVDEGELHHEHSRQLILIPRLRHIVRDRAEVFGDDGKARKSGFERGEQCLGRGLPPASMHCAIAGNRNFPILHQAPEMIDANDIENLEQGSDALDPPAKSLALEFMPVIKGIAPELTFGAEIIRRYA